MIRPYIRHLAPRRRALPFSSGEKAGMRAVTRNSQLRNSEFLCNPLISRIRQKLSSRFEPFWTTQVPSLLNCGSRNPPASSNSMRATKTPTTPTPSNARQSKIENRKWNNPKRSIAVSPCFTICSTLQTLVPQGSSRLFRAVPLCFAIYSFIRLLNQLRPTRQFPLPQILAPRTPRLSPTHSDTLPHTKIFLPPNVMQTRQKLQPPTPSLPRTRKPVRRRLGATAHLPPSCPSNAAPSASHPSPSPPLAANMT